MGATARSVELRSIAQDVADALPITVEEVVLTGSVSRGVADDVSDIEMLVVTRDEPDLEECFSLAAAASLGDLGTWGQQGVPTKRVSGNRDGAPLELVWWSRAHAESVVDAIFEGDSSTTADALAHGVALRTSGLLERWQDRLRDYPEELARARIEDAALTWGGFAAAGLLTIVRPGERLALLERLVDDATRVVRNRLRAESSLGADDQAARNPRRGAASQAGTAGQADRGGADGARSSPGAVRHDRASSRHGRARA